MFKVLMEISPLQLILGPIHPFLLGTNSCQALGVVKEVLAFLHLIQQQERVIQ